MGPNRWFLIEQIPIFATLSNSAPFQLNLKKNVSESLKTTMARASRQSWPSRPPCSVLVRFGGSEFWCAFLALCPALKTPYSPPGLTHSWPARAALSEGLGPAFPTLTLLEALLLPVQASTPPLFLRSKPAQFPAGVVFVFPSEFGVTKRETGCTKWNVVEYGGCR